MIAIVLALASAVSWGCADFVGGIVSRRAHVLQVVAAAAPASLVLEVMVWPVLGADWSGAAVGWGAASGVFSAASFVLLYRCLAIGPMSLLSPITAVISAVLPVAAGLWFGDRLGVAGSLGIALALPAVVLISAGDPTGERATRYGIGLALAAGGAISGQLICLQQAPTSSGVAPLITGRAVSSGVTLLAALIVLRRKAFAAPQGTLWPAAAAGALDSLANLAFLLAVRGGMLSVIAVIVALYPAATVLLARVVLHEHVGRRQGAGLAVAAAAVALLAAT